MDQDDRSTDGDRPYGAPGFGIPFVMSDGNPPVFPNPADGNQPGWTTPPPPPGAAGGTGGWTTPPPPQGSGMPSMPSSPQQPAWGGAPSAAQPGWNPGVEGPKKKRKWPWVLLGIFLFLVLGIGGCTYWVVGKVKGVTEVGNTFADRLYISPQEATKSVCPSSSLTVDQLQTERDALIAAGWTGGKSLFGVQTNSNSSGSTGAITGTFATSPATAVTIDLAKDGSNWCVDGFSGVGGTTLTSVPDFSIPDISIPDVSIPELSVPDVTFG